MENKKGYTKIAILGLASILAVGGVILYQQTKEFSKLIKADTPSSGSISLTSSSNTLITNGSNGSFYTAKGTSIDVSYTGYTQISDKWGSLTTNGYITNDTIINGISSISINLISGTVGLYWSDTKEFTNSNYTTLTSFYTFSDPPRYFKIQGESSCVIESGLISFSCEPKYLSFGSYPQSKLTDSSLQSTLTTLAGTLPTASDRQSWTDYGYYISGSVASYMWYQDITNESIKYRGVYFTSYRPFYTTESSSTTSSYQDDNGYGTSNVYWFKYEPISWKVLHTTDTAYFLFANLNLDSQDYYISYDGSTRTIDGKTVYENNYKESHIRSWLNSTFYDTAFTTVEQGRILTTTVDNSVASTGYSSNTYACDNTNDKVFLLSYAEVTSSTYGLNTSSSRQLSQTDYASCQGISRYTSYTPITSYWWLRSPNNSYSTYARNVTGAGSLYNNFVRNTNYGVAPALWISK